MKKRSAIKGVLLSFFIALYAMSTLGLFSSYLTFYHRSAFQLQVIQVPHEALYTLNLTKEDFKKIIWLEANKEFEYNGKMYDVSKIEQNDFGYSILCENDTFEDLVMNWVKTTGKTASNVILQIHFFEPIETFSCVAYVPQSNLIMSLINIHYSSVSKELITPPPRFS
jgi:hypothetical protein